MSAVSFDSAGKWDARVPLLIIGAGAAGICAALAAKEAGVEAVVIEHRRPPCRPGSFAPPARAFGAPRVSLTGVPGGCSRLTFQ